MFQCDLVPRSIPLYSKITNTETRVKIPRLQRPLTAREIDKVNDVRVRKNSSSTVVDKFVFGNLRTMQIIPVPVVSVAVWMGPNLAE